MAGRYRIGEAVAWEFVRWLVLGVSWVPGIVGVAVRWAVLSMLIGKTNGPFRVLERVTIEFPSRLDVGRHVGLNQGVWINARGGVRLGDDTIVGPYCVIHSANHLRRTRRSRSACRVTRRRASRSARTCGWALT